jgi:hypothetical protein
VIDMADKHELRVRLLACRIGVTYEDLTSTVTFRNVVEHETGFDADWYGGDRALEMMNKAKEVGAVRPLPFGNSRVRDS